MHVFHQYLDSSPTLRSSDLRLPRRAPHLAHAHLGRRHRRHLRPPRHLPLPLAQPIAAASTVAFGVGCSILHTKDRKSTRLNSSHLVISYAVFCLKRITLTSM